jgi:hypothetical protein
VQKPERELLEVEQTSEGMGRAGRGWRGQVAGLLADGMAMKKTKGREGKAGKWLGDKTGGSE